MITAQGGRKVNKVKRTMVGNKSFTGQVGRLVDNLLELRREVFSKILDEKKDVNTECDYPNDITTEQFKQMFEREAIAYRVVTFWPDECWKNAPDVFDSKKEGKVTDWEKRWQYLVDTHNIYYWLHQLDKVAGIGRFGVLLIGFDDGGSLETPVPGIDDKGRPTGQTAKQREILYMIPFDETAVKIKEVEQDPTNPRFGQPTLYNIAFIDVQSGGNATTDAQNKDVHWSRIIHFADNCISSKVVGMPRQQVVYNRLVDLRKMYGGNGEMVWRSGVPSYIFEIDPDKVITNEEGVVEYDEEAAKAQFELFTNSLKKYMSVVGVTAKTIAPTLANPQSNVDVVMEAIAIAMTVPIRTFKGTEDTRVALTQDAKAWNGRVASRNNRVLSPMILRPLVDRFMAVGVMPFVEEYFTEWPDLNTLTDKEKADLALVLTQALAAYVAGSVDQLFPELEFLTLVVGLDNETATKVLEAAMQRLKDASTSAPTTPLSTPSPNAPQQTGANTPGQQQTQQGQQNNPPAAAGNRFTANVIGGLQDPFDELAALLEDGLRVANYSPDQPRDHGKFAEVEGGGTSDSAIGPERFKTVEEAHAWAKKAWKPWAKDLKAHHIKAIDDYTAGKYQVEDENGVTLFDKVRRGDKLTVEEGNMMLRLGHAVKSARAPEPVTVYRGLGGHNETFTPGHTYEDKAFMATTLVRSHAETEYANPELNTKPTVLVLNVPKGATAAYLDAAGDGRSWGQAEVLLGRGTKYKVSKVIEHGGRVYVHADVTGDRDRVYTTNEDFLFNEFDPSQPRDEKGRWGGGAGHGFIKAAKNTVEAAKVAKENVTKFGGKVSALADKVPVLGTVKKGISKAMGKVKDKLANRYGDRAAGIIMASGSIGGYGVMALAIKSIGFSVPIVPDIISIAAHVAVAETLYQAGYLKGKAVKNAAEDTLTEDEVLRLGDEAYQEIAAELEVLVRDYGADLLHQLDNNAVARQEAEALITEWNNKDKE